MKKYLSIFIAVSMLFGLFNFNVVALEAESSVPGVFEKVELMLEENQNVFTLTGEHGSVLLVESISDNEYSELIDILYPNGVIDSQGLDIPGIKNIESVRRDFIINNTEVFSVVDGIKTKIPFSVFEINIQSKSNGEYTVELCKATIGNDVFVFPFEWGSQPYNFVCNSKENLFVVYTDLGIWRINTSNNSAVKISSNAQAYVNRVGSEEGYVVWVDNVVLSPSGSYIVYRSNRDSEDLDDTSIWKINLKTGNETKLINAAENNDIVGFIDENNIVTGSINETKVVNIIDGNAININVPDVPNMVVKAVNKGKIVYTGYPDDSSISTAYIGALNNSNGNIKPITTITGYLDGDVSFAPSGDKIAIGYGEDPAYGINDVTVVDFTNKMEKGIETSAEKFNIINAEKKKVISKYLWLNEDVILVNNITNNNNAKVVDIPSSRASQWDVVFDNVATPMVSFGSPLSNYANVTSKWSQPRTSGSNPHNGVDLHATVNTDVYAPYAGWTTAINITGNYDIELTVDANGNGVQDSSDYKVRFYHMNGREASGYKAKGQKIGKSGNQGTNAAHLHFGISTGSGSSLKWWRNEVNYRHLIGSSYWNGGRDLDIYAQVEWNGSTASLIAYAKDETGKTALQEVRMFYRTTPSGAWTDGGTMTKSGDTYSYNFSGKVSQGSTVYWMVRLKRSGVSQVAFCPAKYYQPVSNPNSTSYAYGYWQNVVN